MGKQVVVDCITFYNENFLTNLRFEILDELVDFFVICESKYDHKEKKNL
jgi:beta-1,4-mannosyl-glycoprotein beta-1,4-N-acetylglucosaminyltransferase